MSIHPFLFLDQKNGNHKQRKRFSDYQRIVMLIDQLLLSEVQPYLL